MRNVAKLFVIFASLSALLAPVEGFAEGFQPVGGANIARPGMVPLTSMPGFQQAGQFGPAFGPTGFNPALMGPHGPGQTNVNINARVQVNVKTGCRHRQCQGRNVCASRMRHGGAHRAQNCSGGYGGDCGQQQGGGLSIRISASIRIGGGGGKRGGCAGGGCFGRRGRGC